MVRKYVLPCSYNLWFDKIETGRNAEKITTMKSALLQKMNCIDSVSVEDMVFRMSCEITEMGVYAVYTVMEDKKTTAKDFRHYDITLSIISK